MKSRRLLVIDIEAIVRRLIDRGFGETVQSTEKEREEMANEIYNDLFTEHELRVLRSMPRSWFPRRVDVFVKVEGEGVGKESIVFPFGEQRPFPYQMLNNVCKVYDAKEPLAERMVELKQRYDVLLQKRSKEKNRLENLLRSFSTTGALIKAWPEIEAIVEDVMSPQANREAKARNLPVVKRDELNSLYDLPPNEEEAA